MPPEEPARRCTQSKKLEQKGGTQADGTKRFYCVRENDGQRRRTNTPAAAAVTEPRCTPEPSHKSMRRRRRPEDDTVTSSFHAARKAGGRRHSAATPATGRCASLYARRCGLYKNYTPENSSLHAKTGADGRTHASKAQAENVPDSYVHYAGDCRRRDSLTCRAPSLGGGSTTSVLCHTEAPYAVAWARRASPSNLEVANRARLISYCCPS